MQSFLCTRCKAVMCEDCVNIAEEYQELETLRKNAMIEQDYEMQKLRRELDRAERKAKMYEEVSKAGMHETVCAWIDKEINQLLDVTPANHA